MNVRTRGKEKTEDMATAEFVEKIKKLIAEKRGRFFFHFGEKKTGTELLGFVL